MLANDEKPQVTREAREDLSYKDKDEDGGLKPPLRTTEQQILRRDGRTLRAHSSG